MVHKKDYCLFYFAPPRFLCVAVIGCTFYIWMKSFPLNHSYFYSYSLVFKRFYFNKSWELHKILVKLQVLKKNNGFRNDFTPMCFGCLAWFSQKNVILEPGSWSFPQISPKSATLHKNTIEIPRFWTFNTCPLYLLSIFEPNKNWSNHIWFQ